ncbi:Senecionine N-oxygenase [Eumeta japonica]|uniref:Flavin-containing monooxygenase n=1 Tax=Eumeta variegata TaxID=151549 RepID=A0A4C1XUR7_EUMVA|nr:Senecionine N-oxygenase [Eumeta japonica]
MVTSVKWADERWNMTYRKTSTGTDHDVSCDFVIIGNGHYSQPKWPKIEGEELFKGNIIHSHDYREAEPYRNRSVLIVGAGASGLDLSTQIVAVAKKLVHSFHLEFNQPAYPNTYIKKPDVRMFTSNGVVFEDDSFEEIDDVIYCTGYDFAHPFLDANSGVTTSGKFVLPLYQHMVNIRHPTMFFIGLTRRTITRVLDAQAEYAAASVAGKFSLPSQEQMLKAWLEHVYALQAKKKKIVDVNYVGEDQDRYFANLTAEAGITRAPPVLTEIMFFNGKIRLDDLLNYRDYEFKIVDDRHYERHYSPKKELPCPITL